jgi:iron complex outermembrane recepter protein
MIETYQRHFKKVFGLFVLILLSGCSASVMAQKIKGTIKGTVIEGQAQAIENVSVRLKNTHYGTVADQDGNFSLRVPSGSYSLVVSSVGYQQRELPVKVIAGQVTDLHEITLTPLTGTLKDVRVNASKTNRFKTRRSDDVAKMPLDNLENPQVYNTIGSNLLTEQQLFTVDDALKNAPGLQTMWNATGRSGDGGGYFNSRGFILQSTLRNGLAGVVSNTNDAVNVDRIEVLKGPSATLFGSTLTSFGGVINRITKKPYDSLGGAISYSTGSYALNRLSADINAPLDAAKKLLFRLNTAFNYQGSFQNNGFSQGAVIDPSLLYKVNDRLSISFDAELSYGKNSAKPIFFFPFSNVSALGTDRADGLALNYRQSYSNDDLDQNSHSDNYYARVNYKISNQWTWQTNFSATNSYSNGFYPYYYLLAKDTISRNDQSTKNSRESIIEVQQNFNGDSRIGNMRNRFVGGLDFFHENSNQYFFGGYFDKVATTLPANAYGNFNYVNLQRIYNSGGIGFTYPILFKTNTYSAYAADVLNITSRLLALASLRIDHYDNDGGMTGGAATASYTQTALSPKFGLVYQLVENEVSLFGNYQNGFINPGAYTAYGDQSQPIVSKIARVQNAAQIEGGIKLDLFEGRLASTLSYYDIALTNVLRADPNAAHTLQNPNAQLQDGTQLSKGLEAELIANPLKGLNLVAGFSYNDSKYTRSDSTVLGRRPATAAAPYTANFYASYRLPKNVVNGLGFGFGGNYASDNKIVNSTSQGVFILPAYSVLNASAFYERAVYRINLAVNNLTDKEYWVGYSSLNPQMLRQLIVSLTYKF